MSISENGAFFQMEKNPKREILTDADYIAISKSCMENANSFFDVATRCLPLLYRSSEAVFTNIAFACELYLKALLYFEKTDAKHTHDLSALFHLLPLEYQQRIIQTHPCTNIPRENFELDLKEIGKAFSVLRYSFERSMLSCNVQFLGELMATLAEITNTAICPQHEG